MASHEIRGLSRGYYTELISAEAGGSDTSLWEEAALEVSFSGAQCEMSGRAQQSLGT